MTANTPNAADRPAERTSKAAVFGTLLMLGIAAIVVGVGVVMSVASIVVGGTAVELP